MLKYTVSRYNNAQRIKNNGVSYMECMENIAASQDESALPQRGFTLIDQRAKRGFTLIELSIVLVIIGLIVGGILVGQDMIRAAEVRATVGQIEKYNSAVNTFRTKFNGIPGDLPAATASAFGFTTRAGTAGRGDGNYLVDTTVTGLVYGQEPALFWNDLSTANLVDGSFSGADSAAPVAVASTTVPTVFPAAKMGRGNYFTVGSTSGLNYYFLAGISSVTVTTGSYTLTANITPTEAYNMDNKLDDGMPVTGIVQAHAAAGTGVTTAFTDAPSSAASSTAGKCLAGDAPGTATTDTYNVALSTGGATQACMLRFRFN